MLYVTQSESSFPPGLKGIIRAGCSITVKERFEQINGHNINTRLSRFLFKYHLIPQTTPGQCPEEMLGHSPKLQFDPLRPDVKGKMVNIKEKQKEACCNYESENII
ncbi:hypothetical protein XENOCAPTIV_026134 [Xenoophorus captivus]|uniref:Uncharacterized protein n=1 Tax=Xenoophorus captivus TaxID=1517983 RepID=A0ABV0Q756_9TELE